MTTDRHLVVDHGLGEKSSFLGMSLEVGTLTPVDGHYRLALRVVFTPVAMTNGTMGLRAATVAARLSGLYCHRTDDVSATQAARWEREGKQGEHGSRGAGAGIKVGPAQSSIRGTSGSDRSRRESAQVRGARQHFVVQQATLGPAPEWRFSPQYGSAILDFTAELDVPVSEEGPGERGGLFTCQVLPREVLWLDRNGEPVPFRTRRTLLALLMRWAYNPGKDVHDHPVQLRFRLNG